MKKLIKNPFERKQKGAVVILCFLFFMTSNCGKQNSAEESTDVNAFLEQLDSASSINVPKENLPEWLVVRTNQVEIRPSSICKVLIYKGEWNKQIVYFILDTFSSCLCDFFTENGERILDNLSDCRATSKNWILIYEYGEIDLNLDELLKN